MLLKTHAHDFLPGLANLAVREDTLDGRFYLTPEGRRYPSVTTALGTMPKPWLQSWRARIGEEEADRQMKRAARRGERLHKALENYVLNRPLDTDPITLSYFIQVQRYVDEFDVWHGVESRSYSDRLKLGGSMDGAGVLRGRRTIVDFKTSNGEKLEEDILSYFYQTVAYSMMAEERTGLDWPQLAIIIAVENGQPKCFVRDTKDFIIPALKFYASYHAERRVAA